MPCLLLDWAYIIAMALRLILIVVFAASFGAAVRAESTDGLQVDATLLATMGEHQAFSAYRLRLPPHWTTRKVASDVWLFSGPSGQLRFEIRKRRDFNDQEPTVGSSSAELRGKKDWLIAGPSKTIRHATVNGLKMIIAVEDRRQISFAAFDADKFIVFYGTRMRSQADVSAIETIVSTLTRSGGPEEMVPPASAKGNEPMPRKNQPATAPAAEWQSAVDPPPKPCNWKVDPQRKVRLSHSSYLFCPPRPSSFFVVQNTISGRQAHMRFDVFDFQTGTETGVLDDMLHNGLPLLSEDGEFIAQRGNDDMKSQIHVVVSSTKTHAPVHTLPDEIPIGFAGAGRLLTQVYGNSHRPQFHLWDVKTGQLLQNVTVEEVHGTPDVHDSWCISPGNRFFAVFLSPDMYLIDLSSGKLAARLAIPDARFSGLTHGVAFSPDGTRLAFYVSNSLSADASHRVQPRMLVWDLSNGKLIFSKAITLPLEFDESSRRSPYFNTPLQWFPDQKAWLLFGRLVVDIASGTVVYKLELTRKTAGGIEDYPRLLLDGQHIMMRDPDFSSGDGVTYQFDFIRTQELPRAMIEAAIAAASKGEAIAQVNTTHKLSPSGGIFYTAPRVVPDAEPDKEKGELRTLRQLMPTINSIASMTTEFQRLSTLAPGPQLARTERELQQLGTKLPANAQNVPRETAESIAAIKQSIPRLLALQRPVKKRAENYQEILHEEFDVIGPECKFLQARYKKLSDRYPNS